MEWLLAIVLVGGGGFAAKRWRDHLDRRRTQAADLEGVRRLAEEDVTVLGEQLQRLGREVEGHELDEATRLDYQTALDAYETAKDAVPRIRRADEISTIVDTLSSGRYAMACVQAGVAGTARPEQRSPCFFNPQHGPSVTEVLWTPPGRGTRLVPACVQDAARVAEHESPEVRTVRVGSRRVPYWEAGAAYLPYTVGYFGGAAAMTWAIQPPISDAGPWLGHVAEGLGDAGGSGDAGGWGDAGGGFDGGG
jgi:hypothetical protein